MTMDPKDQAILDARARKLAERGTAARTRTLVGRVVMVEAGRGRYGLPIDTVREIVAATPITPLRGLPAFMLGIAAVRGEVLTVVDLGELHGQAKCGTGALLAVVQAARGPIAFRIETVLGLRDVFEDEVAENLSHTDAGRMLPVMFTHDLVTLVDVARLLASDRLIAHAAQAPAAAGVGT
jgi:purine-binding chemotaxis protein CheW